MAKFTINLETCNRTGMCYFEHPELFREREEDGYPVLLESAEEVELSEAEADEVVLLCPTGSLLHADG